MVDEIKAHLEEIGEITTEMKHLNLQLRTLRERKKSLGVKVIESKKEARVTVPADQLSLAIGKQGQNVRLAAKLTGWKIDVVTGETREEEKKDDVEKDSKETEKKGTEEEKSEAKKSTEAKKEPKEKTKSKSVKKKSEEKKK